ncbi:type VI secretion system baseplate subunit TssF [Burkholderia pyrrocinia]
MIQFLSNMFRKFRIDILSIVIAVILPGLLIWFKGDWVGLHSVERRAGWIVALCVVFVVWFLWFSFDSSSRPAIAVRRIKHWVAKQINASTGEGDSKAAVGGGRAAVLRSNLLNRHGWRWRYRDRWVLVAGDEPFVRRLAPGLVDTGSIVLGNTVLLYARQIGDQLDTEWLDQIRRLRRRRPVDAIVAVTRSCGSVNASFDTDELTARLARHTRALRWAAPAYLLDGTDFGGEWMDTDEAIGFTWANTHVNETVIDESLRNLLDDLADSGVMRLAANASDRYQLLLEYFTFREKFLFVDLCGLDVAKLPEGATRFELEFVLKHAYPVDQRFSAENVRLFCTPVINLFELDAEPIEIDHHETEYRVVPAGHQGEHVETYSVDAVATFDHDTAERYEYVPFATFRHRGGMLRHEAPERYFHTRVRPGMSGLHETWVILGGHAWETMDTLPEESLSLRVTGTNGMLPRKGLREASLNEIAVSTQSVAGVRNLVSPTLPLYPPTEDRFQWRVLSHLAPNFLSMMNAEVLRGALALYDWTSDELNRRRLAGIFHVSQELIEEVSGGAVERGVLIEITLDSHAFSGEGDVMLFGELLHRFFEAYAEINLFTKLAIVSLPSQRRTEWPRGKVQRAAL